MLAAYTEKPNFDDPLSALIVGEMPEPLADEGSVKVRVQAASLNRHDLWTLRGVTQHPPLPLPMILGCDGAGLLEDGTPVIIYPGMGDPDWHDEETLDPRFHVLSELRAGAMAEYIVVPKRCVIPRPAEVSAVEAAALGTAWLTAYKMLFVRSGMKPGQRMLVQGASGGVSTALIQLGSAAGMEIWVTGRTDRSRALAAELGAHRTFASGEPLPEPVDAVFETVGEATWSHSLASVRRGGTVVVAGRTSGKSPKANLRRVFINQLNIQGSVLGTLDNMRDMVRFIVHTGIRPKIGAVMPLAQASDGFRAMWEGDSQGKTIFTPDQNQG
ncbi:MAG: zinc-binding dehydrogenase [Alphaproteobacteria bacterium]|nr:zinc-binding dehydrogenase [Alphaproteobacteria bacterium]